MEPTTTIPTTRSRTSRRRPAPEVQRPPEAHPAAEVPPSPPAAGAPAPALAVPDPAPPAPISAPAATTTEVPTPKPPPPLVEVAAAPSIPSILPLPGSPFHQHDVVQVLDRSSRHYGQFFMVGDVRYNKVHGYYLTEGLHKDYITVDIQYCLFIGSPKAGSGAVRSAQPCSPKWLADRGGS